MRVLWFSITSSNYSNEQISNNGRGWVASLENIIRMEPSIELGIAFEHQDSSFKVCKNNVIYYPINVLHKRTNRIKHKFFYELEEEKLIPACKSIVKDFKPDIIHVFGSEWSFGLIQEHTRIPVVIHMQGSIPPYYNARFPPGYNSMSFLLYNKLHLGQIFKQLNFERVFKLRAKREERILRNCNFFMGRTEWDKRIARLYSPFAKYYYCSEALRDSFVDSCDIWQFKEKKKIIIVSTISALLLKGFDTILKTARNLKDFSEMEFEWRVIGSVLSRFVSNRESISVSKVNVTLLGMLSEEEVKNELLNSDVYVHPSYIDNSPNSLCEAQYLGVPVIATFVGGIPSLIKNNETGILVPANDPYLLASNILELTSNRSRMEYISTKSREIARKRHDRRNIALDLLAIYSDILKKSK